MNSRISDLLRWFSELGREMDRGRAVMRGEKPEPPSPWVAPGLWEPETQTRHHDNGALEVRAALPGVELEDVDVSVGQRPVLTISGISDGRAFRREVILPDGLDVDGLEAKAGHGMLWVAAPASDGCETGYPVRVPVEGI